MEIGCFLFEAHDPECSTIAPGKARWLRRYTPLGSRVTMHLLLPWVLMCVAMLAPERSAAQQDATDGNIRVGLAADVGLFGRNGAELPIFPGGVGCGTFSDAAVTQTGLAAEIQAPSLLAFIGPGWGASARLGWFSSRSRFAATPSRDPVFPDPTSGQPVFIEHQYHLTSETQRVQLAAQMRYKFGFNLWLSAGATAGIRVRTVNRRTDSVIGPDQSFADGERGKPILDPAPDPIPRTFSLGLIAEIGYQFTVGHRVTLVLPRATVRTELLSNFADVSWRDRAFGVGGSLVVRLGSDPAVDSLALDSLPRPDSVVARADTVRPDTSQPIAKAPPRLAASIRMEGIDDNGVLQRAAVIRVGEVIFRDNIPILPVIYFDHGADTIAARYPQMVASATREFSYASVAEFHALEMSHRVLDLIGYRLRKNRSGKLLLYGTTSADEPDELGVKRAERIRTYLATVWGIARNRLETRAGIGPMPRSDDATEDGRVENRRVVMVGSEPDLLNPIATERMVRDFNPPSIRLTPLMEAEAGVAAWDIKILEGALELASFTSADARAGRTGLLWRLDDRRIDGTLGQLVAELRVRDSVGQVLFARDTIGLQVSRDSTVVLGNRTEHGERERLAYSLVGFGYRSSVGDKSHEELLAELASQLRGEAQIRVTGYTDRIGDDAYNAELSRARAQYVADALRELGAKLGVRGLTVEIRGAGVDTQRYPNDLPEGRVLSRGATVVVEQPRQQK